MKILNFGSLNIDHVYTVDHFVRAGETLSASDLQLFCGGKGLNQSIALRRCGVEVFHAGAVGADGDMLLDLLKENGVHTENILVKNCPSGHAIIQNDRQGQNCIMLFGGANQALIKEDIDKVLERFDKGDFVLLQNEINDVAYIMEKAHEKGMKVILNPSPADEKIFSCPMQYVNYLILNEIEMREIYSHFQGDVTDVSDETLLAVRMCRLFPEMKIILTLGERGSFYADTETTIRQKAYKAQAVDTTAAGDTFTGYVFGSILKGSEMDKALDLASRASALAVMRKGAAPSIPWRKEVEDFEFLS